MSVYSGACPDDLRTEAKTQKELAKVNNRIPAVSLCYTKIALLLTEAADRIEELETQLVGCKPEWVCRQGITWVKHPRKDENPKCQFYDFTLGCAIDGKKCEVSRIKKEEK